MATATGLSTRPGHDSSCFPRRTIKTALNGDSNLHRLPTSLGLPGHPTRAGEPKLVDLLFETVRVCSAVTTTHVRLWTADGRAASREEPRGFEAVSPGAAAAAAATTATATGAPAAPAAEQHPNPNSGETAAALARVRGPPCLLCHHISAGQATHLERVLVLLLSAHDRSPTSEGRAVRGEVRRSAAAPPAAVEGSVPARAAVTPASREGARPAAVQAIICGG